MIDGVKILCNLSPSDWTSNKNLSFRSWTDLSTGEIPHDSKHADLKGLHLSIISGRGLSAIFVGLYLSISTMEKITPLTMITATF
mgnify:CR=1 FL=1